MSTMALRNRWLDFGGDLDHYLDLGILKKGFYHSTQSNTGGIGLGGGMSFLSAIVLYIGTLPHLFV